MSGPTLSVCVLLAALCASAIIGLLIIRTPISLLISGVFGITTAVVRGYYDPHPAVLPGFVGYPLMCMGMNRFGAFLHRWIRS